MKIARIIALAATALHFAPAAQAQQADMTFFVTSVSPGKGADLGGLDGADGYCGTLAKAAGAKATGWKAYLSTQGAGAVNARDRIGAGPWQNAKGVVVARDVAQLHGANNLTKQTALTEKGEVVNGRGDTPNMHDILTGSQADGTAFAVPDDKTCGNWSRNGTEGSAIVGHSDRTGLDQSPPMISWISSHPTRGCDINGLKSTGGAGLFYCFAAK